MLNRAILFFKEKASGVCIMLRLNMSETSTKNLIKNIEHLKIVGLNPNTPLICIINCWCVASYVCILCCDIICTYLRILYYVILIYFLFLRYYLTVFRCPHVSVSFFIPFLNPILCP